MSAPNWPRYGNKFDVLNNVALSVFPSDLLICLYGSGKVMYAVRDGPVTLHGLFCSVIFSCRVCYWGYGGGLAPTPDFVPEVLKA